MRRKRSSKRVVIGFYTEGRGKNRKVRPITAPVKGGKFFAAYRRRTIRARYYLTPYVTLVSPPASEKALPEVVGGDADSPAYKGYREWIKGRGVKLDLVKSNKRLLDPTNPVHWDRYLRDPGRYDMADFDTPARDKDRIEIFRGLQIKYDRTISDLNRPMGLGKSWTGDIHVARFYAIRGTTDVKSPQDLKFWDEKCDKLVEEINKTKKVPWVGVIVRYVAKGKEVTEYNPESFPWEQEARMSKGVAGKGKPLAERYPGLEIGFLKGPHGRRVEWHKIRPEDEHVSLSEIAKRKPDRVTVIPRVKEVKKDVYQVRRFGTVKGAKGKDVAKHLKKQLSEQAEHKPPKPKGSSGQVYSGFKLTYPGGTKIFKKASEALKFIYSQKLYEKGFNLWSPKGEIVLAKKAEGWNPAHEPPSKALKDFNIIMKNSKDKFGKEYWIKAIDAVFFEPIKASKAKNKKEKKATAKHTSQISFTDFKDAFKKHFGAIYHEPGYVNPAHTLGLFPWNWAKKSFMKGPHKKVSKALLVKSSKGKKGYTVLGSEVMVNKTYLNKALKVLGGASKVEILWPEKFEHGPVLVKRKGSDAVIAIAPIVV